MGIGDLVEDEKRVAWPGPCAQLGKRRLFEEVGLDECSLMDGVGAQELVEVTGGGSRCWHGALGQGCGKALFGILGEEYALDLAAGIGEDGCDSVNAIDE